MNGLDGLGTHELIGFDFEALLKGAAGMLQGAGSKEDPKAAAAAEQHRLEAEKAAKASRLKTILIAVGAVVGVGGVVALVRLGRK